MNKKLDYQWRTYKNVEIDLMEELSAFVSKKSLSLHIGTDAQAFGPGTADYVTCVVVHGIGDDGRSFASIFYIKDKEVRTNSLWEKLYNETMGSISVAMEIADLEEKFRDRIVVHVDANPKAEYASNNYVKQLAGMVMGYGFKHLLKPDSWASSHAADHIVKHKNEKTTKSMPFSKK